VMPEYASPAFVRIRTGLLEPKHVAAMGGGNEMWLYVYLHTLVWFRGERAGTTREPYTHERAAQSLGVSDRAVRAWFASLRRHGYVTSKRLQYGLDVTITNYQPDNETGGRAEPARQSADAQIGTDAPLSRARQIGTKPAADRNETGGRAEPARQSAGLHIESARALSRESREQEGGARAREDDPPPHLADFDRALRGFAEYHPTADYYALVDRYLSQIRELNPDFDLSAERVKLVDHHQRKGGGIGIGNVLTWLDVALKRAKEDAAKRPATKPLSRRTFTPPSGQRTSPPAELRARLDHHTPPAPRAPHGEIA
jgi:hypothetical protein